MPQCAGEEPAGSRQIPLLRHQHVDDLPELVDRPVEVDPPPSDLGGGFIDEPPITRAVSAGPGCIDQQRCEALYPPEHGVSQASFIHHAMTRIDVTRTAILNVSSGSRTAVRG